MKTGVLELETLLQLIQEYSNEIYYMYNGSANLGCYFESFDSIPYWAINRYYWAHHLTEQIYDRGLQAYIENPDGFLQSKQFRRVVLTINSIKLYLHELNERDHNTPLIDNLGKYTTEKLSKLSIQHPFKPQSSIDKNPNIFYYHNDKPSYVCFWNKEKAERNKTLSLYLDTK